MDQYPADPSVSSPLSYARPGTYRSPRHYTGTVIASYVVATLHAVIWISWMLLAILSFSEAAREAGDSGQLIIVIIISLVMTALAITLLVAALELRKLRPVGFRLHRVFAVGQLLANAALFLFLLFALGDAPGGVWVVFLSLPVLLSVYPIILLLLLRGRPEDSSESGSPSTFSSATSP